MLQIKLYLTRTTIAIFITAVSLNANGQDWKTEKKINVLFGLSQIFIANGFNVEGNYIHNRVIFDYSHGVSLDFKGSLVTDELKKQGVAVHMPWTTGFGIGYRFAEWLNVRVEPKWHRFEFFYENEQQNISNEITSYNTFSLGLGIYGSYQPFKKKNNFLKGIMISPSIRYWPTIYSTLKDNKFIYHNKNTGTNEEIKTLDPGIGFTAFVVNISIGYSFKL